MSGEIVYLTALLLVLSKAVVPTLLTNGEATAVSIERGLPLYQIVVSCVYLIGIVKLMQRPKAAIRWGAHSKLPLTLAALSYASVMWSVYPELTARRAVALVTGTLTAGYVATRYNCSEIRRCLRYAGWIAGSVSVAWILFLPEFGLHEGLHDGAWRGAFLHKNTFAQFMSLMCVLFLFDLIERKRQLAAAVGCALSALFVVFAESRTAWVVTPLVCGILIVARLWPKRIVAWIGLGAIGVAIGASIGWELVLQVLGRDSSLTGRLPLWRVILEDVAERPVLGYGYGAYWAGQSDLTIATAALGWRVAPTHAHNGFLDVLVELGVVGTTVTLLIVGKAIAADAGLLRRGYERSDNALRLTLLALVVSYAVMGGEFVSTNSLYWTLLVISYSGCASNWRAADVKLAPSRRRVLTCRTATSYK